jgi:hypothetical protein
MDRKIQLHEHSDFQIVSDDIIRPHKTLVEGLNSEAIK